MANYRHKKLPKAQLGGTTRHRKAPPKTGHGDNKWGPIAGKRKTVQKVKQSDLIQDSKEKRVYKKNKSKHVIKTIKGPEKGSKIKVKTNTKRGRGKTITKGQFAPTKDGTILGEVTGKRNVKRRTFPKKQMGGKVSPIDSIGGNTTSGRVAKPKKKKRNTYSTTTPKAGTYGGTTSATKTTKRGNVTKTKTVRGSLGPYKGSVTKTKTKTKKSKTQNPYQKGPGKSTTVTSTSNSRKSISNKRAKRIEKRYKRKTGK